MHVAEEMDDSGDRENQTQGRPDHDRPESPCVLCVLASWRETKMAAVNENAIAKEIVDAAYRIHTVLGPGPLESVDDAVLAYELGRRGLRTTRQQPFRWSTRASASTPGSAPT
jgi:hypothetical protein